ncbi:MAG: C10 family peptidase [Candidatus Amulumruptor caecigallinarius]|nr:C10 family peptidase [Candidatus Amulumruptor caecigallinarius]MCM1396603.1 C10 family peptidase [Candidatus Amulumruptor caecigallinarius]MCM1453339.1 C10 family peptidase [bacterium]
MKKLYALALAAAVTLPAQAEWLSPAEALQRAGQAPQSVSASKSITALRMATRPARTVKAKGSDRDALYIYNLPDGAVALSGSSLTRAVAGRLDRPLSAGEELPANLAYWLDEVARQIEYAEQAGLDASRTVAPASRVTVDPLLTAKWSQDEPYNRRCPKVYDPGMAEMGMGSDSIPSVTGCVATAIAEVCKYHRYPASGKGVVDYESHYGHYVQDMTKLRFDYSKMLDEYIEGQYTDEQADAVAELMLGCGMAVRMSYLIGASGSTEQKAYEGLPKHLGYSRGLLLFDHEYVPVREWDALIYGELAAGRPVLYYGANEFGQGHAWVCDGYDAAEDLFHFDFGWAGGGNGWFSPSLIDPSPWNTGYGNLRFVFTQSVIVGVEPPHGEDLQRPMLQYDEGFSVETATMALPGKISVNKGSIIKPTEEWEQFKGQAGLKLTREDGSGDDIYLEGPSLDGMYPSQGPWWYSVDVPELPDGKYRVSPVCRGSEGDWYPCEVKMETAPYAFLTVTGGMAHVANASDPKLRVTDVKFSNPVAADGKVWFGVVVEATVTIRNEGEADCYDQLFMRMKDTGGKVLSMSLPRNEMGRLVIPGGGEITGRFSIGMSGYASDWSTLLDEQDCTLSFVIAKNWDYEDISDDIPAHFAGNDYADPMFAKVGELENLRFRDGTDPDNLDRDEIHFDGTYRHSDSFGDGYAAIKIYDITDGEDTFVLSSDSADRLFLLPGQSVDWTYTLSLPILEPGHTYRFEHGYSNFLLGSVTGRIRPDGSGAAESVAADASPVVSEQWYTPAGVAVSPATAAPGLYIVRALHADGSVTTAKRHVK